MFQLGLNPDNGGVGAKRSDARRLREQMQRLFNAAVSFEQTIVQEGRQGEGRVNMTVASRVMLWWSPRDPAQAALWGSWVELSRTMAAPIIGCPAAWRVRMRRVQPKCVAIEEHATLRCRIPWCPSLAGTNMHRTLEATIRTLAVLSLAYCASGYCREEWTAALAKARQDGADLPVRIADFAPPGLFAPIAYLDLVERRGGQSA
jgi:hypothetical protein